MSNRGYGIVPALPTAETPYLTEEGHLHPQWRVYHEDVSDQLVFNGKDTIFALTVEINGVSSSVSQEAQARVDGDAANAALITAVEVRTTAAEASINTNATAIVNEATARAAQDNTLQANIDAANALITTNANAIATETSARGSADTTLQANIDGVSASVSTNASAIATLDGEFSASYTLSVDAGGVVTGYTAQSDGSTSSFVIQADEFKGKGATTDIVPITVTGDKVRFGADVEIDGSLTVDGTLTIGKAASGFYGARKDFDFNYTSSPQGSGTDISFAMSTDGDIQVKFKCLNDQFNLTFRVGVYTGANKTGTLLDEITETVELGSIANGWLFKTLTLTAQSGTVYVHIDPTVESGDTYTRLIGRLIEIPIPA